MGLPPRTNRVVGRCYACGEPVWRDEVSWVLDSAVMLEVKNDKKGVIERKKLKRIVHRGQCQDKAQTMLLGSA